MPATLTPPKKPASSFHRMHRYMTTIPDPEDQKKLITIDLVVDRGPTQTMLRMGRDQRGRRTEITLDLDDEQRRELARLLA